MTKEIADRFIGLGTSIGGGLTVQLIVRDPMLALLTGIAILFASMVLLARGFPIIFPFDLGAHKMLGYETCYNDQNEAVSSMVSATHTTQRLDIMLIRGHSFILHDDALVDKLIDNTQNLQIRVLLLAPEGRAMEAYLNKRNLDQTKRQQYVENCTQVVARLDALKSKYDLEYAHYDFFPSWKLIITDSKIFVAAYDGIHRGSHLHVALYHNMGKPYFIAFSNYFDQVWKKFAIRNKQDRRLRKHE